jgi:hypothetical protein
MRSGIGNDPRDPIFTVAVSGTRNADGSFTPGNSSGGSAVYQLATNATIAATTGTASTTGVQGGSYLWDVQFTGTSVVLHALGSDGTTWRNVATATTSGTVGVVIGQNATLRLYNPNGTADTGVYSSIS